MAGEQREYLLASDEAELERLRLQARLWEPEVERWLDAVNIQPGWNCVDLGCGAMGILGPLGRRVGAEGRVVGVDMDAKQLAGARAYVEEEKLQNVEIRQLDAYDTGLPAESFDFVHVRFVFAPVGRDEELMREMVRLARPGGILGIQESNASSWECYPPDPAWDSLKGAILTAFKRGGGDFNAGQRTFGMLRAAGMEQVQARAGVIGLANGHPYMRLPVLFAGSLRSRILEGDIMSERELDDTIAECERIAADPNTMVVSFMVTQVWGRKGRG